LHVLYLTPGHPAHDRRFGDAITSAGHTFDIVVIPDSLRGDARRRELVDAAIERARPDVVHAGPIQAVTRLAAEAGGRPLLAVSWGFDLLADTNDPALRDQAVWTLERSDALLVDSAAAGSVAGELGMPGDRIVTLPWGVELDRYTPGRTEAGIAIRTESTWGSKAIVFIMTRSLEPRYGVDVAIRGFLAAAVDEPAIRLLVVGDGSLRPMLESLVADAAMRDRVRFAGQLAPEALPAWFTAADAYLSASHVDGSSLSLLEAMATGLPAIVSSIPGNREWVEPGISGLLFLDGDPAALTTAVLDLVGSGAERMAQMGRRGREIVVARADWHANLPRLFDAYRIAQGHAG